MIDEYQAERQAPIRVGDKDFKYFPTSGLAGFTKELPDPSKINPILSDAQIKQLNDEINASILEISRLNQRIQEIQSEELPQLANDFDDEMSRIQSGASKSDPVQLQSEYDLKIKTFNDEIVAHETEIALLEAEVEGALSDIRDNGENQLETENELRRVDQINKGRIRELGNELNVLNRGNLNMEQRPDETDDEYLIRMQEVGIARYDASQIISAAVLVNKVRAKANLLKLVSNEWNAENIIKMLSDEDIFQFNKNSIKIIKDFLDSYGKDNQNVSDDDVYEFIVASIDNPNANLSSVVIAEAIKSSGKG